MRNNLISHWRKILLITVCIVTALLIFFLWRHLSQYTVSGSPHIQLVLEQDRGNRNTLPNGHLVGGNFIYYNDDGSYQYEDVPSLQGEWQLGELYAKRAWITMTHDAEYVSVFCADGKLRRLPYDIHVVRFNMDVVTGKPGDTPDWAEGVEIGLESHGNFYRIYDPVPNSVYVARTVWEHGALEYAWVLATE